MYVNNSLNICPASPLPTKDALAYEYVKYRLSPEIKCISFTLPEGKILYQPELSSIVQKIIACTQSREILNNVLRDGPLTILSLGEKGDTPNSYWSPHARVVRLHPDLNDAKLSYLLEALCVAEFSVQWRAFEHEINSGLLNKEAYVERREKLKYQASHRFGGAEQACIANDGRPKEAGSSFQIDWDTFWGGIKNVKLSEFQKDWESTPIRNSYCQKNPGAADCR